MIINRTRRAISIALAMTVCAPWALAQEPVPTSGTSLPEVVEAIQRAANPVRVLYIIAHPDDEGGMVGALAYLSRGLGAEVALLALTRGEGGQNALGPEQAPQLGVLRSQELLAATRQYGVKLLFTRAQDFGFSKSADEAMKVWGDAVRKDMLRIIEEEFCPDIVINGWGGVRTGHGQHQASGILADQMFAEAVKGGAGKCIPGKLLHVRRGEASQGWPVPADEVSPLWGKSYNEIGAMGFANHRTQGVVGFRLAAFLRRRPSLAPVGDAKIEAGDFRGSLSDIARTHPHVGDALPLADAALAAARQAALGADWKTTARQLAAAGRVLDAALKHFRPGTGGSLDSADSAQARIAARLQRQKQKIDYALAMAAALQIRAQADRAEVVPGESFVVRIDTQQRAGVEVKLAAASLVLPAGWQASSAESEQRAARFTVTVPANAAQPAHDTEWMHAFPLPLVQVRTEAEVDGYKFAVTAPVTAERVTSTRVDTLPLTLVPALTLAPEPRQFVAPSNGGRGAQRLSMEVRVRHYGAGAAQVTAGVEAPRGWRATPPVALKFDGPGDQLVRFEVTLPAGTQNGSYPLKIYARRGDEVFTTSLEPLPTLPTRLWSEPALANVRVFDLNVPRDLRVGYIAAENDPIPAALRQVGVRVEMLDEAGLAFGDLLRFDAIAVGVRAYELRQDVIRANKRLLDYAAAGGTLVVQYQRDSDWNRLRPGPYPAGISPRPAPGTQSSNPARIRPERVTDENAPVRLLAPNHAALKFPNAITQPDFAGWVQERGLYFWTEFDSRYQPLLAMRDPADQEDATGALVCAPHGKGAYIYTGLAFFRQLPAGVPGAYRLFINLLSQSKSSGAR